MLPLNNDSYYDSYEPSITDYLAGCINKLNVAMYTLDEAWVYVEGANLFSVSTTIYELYQKVEDLKLELETKLIEWNGTEGQYDTVEEKEGLT